MAVFLRRLVSQKKRRFVQDGFDLDLSYITLRIIAMGFPADGGEGLYRNPMHETIKFLQHYHPGHHKVYNLCAEKTYCTDRFQCEVLHFPFDDHQPPPLALVEAFVADAVEWLHEDPQNIIAVHCKAGKGRTGVMICCLLLFLAQANSKLIEDLELADDAVSDVLRWYAMKRTFNGKGITLVSQQRFVGYYYHMLVGNVKDTSGAVCIKEIRLKNLPQHILRDAVLVILHRPQGAAKATTYLSGPAFDRQFLRVPSCFGGAAPGTCHLGATIQVMEEQDLCATFACGYIAQEDDTDAAVKNGVLQGDVKIQLFKGADCSTSLFYTWFNTAFLPRDTHCHIVQAHELDRPAKGLPLELEIQVTYTPVPSPILLHSETSASSLLSVPQPSTPDAGEAPTPTLHPFSTVSTSFHSPFTSHHSQSTEMLLPCVRASLDSSTTEPTDPAPAAQLQPTLSDVSTIAVTIMPGDHISDPPKCPSDHHIFSPSRNHILSPSDHSSLPPSVVFQNACGRQSLHLPLTALNLAALGKEAEEFAPPVSNMLSPRASSDSGWVLEAARGSLASPSSSSPTGPPSHRRCLSATSIPSHTPSPAPSQPSPQQSDHGTSSSQALTAHSLATSTLSPPIHKSHSLYPFHTKHDPHYTPNRQCHTGIKAANFPVGLSDSDRSSSFALLNTSPTSSFPSPSCSQSGATSPCTPANRDQRKNSLFSIEIEAMPSITADSSPSASTADLSLADTAPSTQSPLSLSPLSPPTSPPRPALSCSPILRPTIHLSQHRPHLHPTPAISPAPLLTDSLPPVRSQTSTSPLPPRNESPSSCLSPLSASPLHPTSTSMNPALPPLHPSTLRLTQPIPSSSHPSPNLRFRPPSIIPPSPTHLPPGAPVRGEISQNSQTAYLTPTGSCCSTSSFSSWTSYIAIVRRHPSRAGSRRFPSSHRHTGSFGAASTQSQSQAQAQAQAQAQQPRKEPRNLLRSLLRSFRKRKTPALLPTKDAASFTMMSPQASSLVPEVQTALTPPGFEGVHETQMGGYQAWEEGQPRWDNFEDDWASRWWMSLE